MEKTYDSNFKSCVALDDDCGNHWHVSNPSESGSAVGRETHGERFRGFSDQSGAQDGKKPYTEDDLMKKIGRLEVKIDCLRHVSLACGWDPEKLR